MTMLRGEGDRRISINYDYAGGGGSSKSLLYVTFRHKRSFK